MDEECASVCFGRLCKSYSLTVPKLPTRDSMTDEQFDRIMENGYKQAKNGQTLSIDEAFAKIREGL